MRQVRSVNTSPEVMFRKALFSLGYRYRINAMGILGKPDVFLPRYHSLIFVNGCYWHWHGCRRSRLPKSNTEYWHAKISKNVTRDRSNYEKLLKENWRVLIVWECALKKTTIIETARLSSNWLKGSAIFSCIEPDPDNCFRPHIVNQSPDSVNAVHNLSQNQ